MESGFHLAKWYFDSIADDGELCIGYAAVVRWKTFTVHYTSVLHGKVSGAFTSSTSLLSSAMPVVDNDTIRWNCKDLRAGGEWKKAFPAVEKTLLENEDGSIRWTCHMPGAASTMSIGGHHVSGSGYVEFLEMTIPPWKLPIEELRWGRFVSPTEAIVWIDWRGIHPLRLTARNGSEIECSGLDDSILTLQGGRSRLTLDRSTVIRSGPIINTALKKIPGIELVIPKNILRTDECKWLSRGSFVDGDAPASTGYAVHEIVRFI